MLARKSWLFICLGMLILCQPLYPQFVIRGIVRDNGSEPVNNALVEIIDQCDASRIFSSNTNELGEYLIQVTETAISNNPAQPPTAFCLLQNYPNPFNPSTVISYEIPRPAHIRIEIYNILGHKIKTLFDSFQNNLYGRVIWDATNDRNVGVAAGVYIYSLSTEGIRINRKMLLLDGHLAKSDAAGSVAAITTANTPVALYKSASNQYTLRISGMDIETFSKQDVQVTSDTHVDVNVIRTLTDIDGNVYSTVKIGAQWWMAVNLRVKHFRNGEPIPFVADSTEWVGLNTGACCSYKNSDVHKNGAGALYNWFALDDNRNIAPVGWHVPSDAEWQNLIDYLGGFTIACGKLKEAGLDHWIEPNFEATNESGFTARSGGYRDPVDGNYMTKGYTAYFWSATGSSATAAWGRQLLYIGADVFHEEYPKQQGCSVRLIRDYDTLTNIPILVTPANGAVDVFTNVNLKWSPLDGASSYNLQISTNPDFTTLAYDQGGITSASRQVDVLADSSLYYWRVQAANDFGATNWSNFSCFTTGVTETGTVTDIDGNVYKTVKIGNRWWMAENLKVTHYRNGVSIPDVTDNAEWYQCNTGAFCYYNNDSINAAALGALYNKYALTDSLNIAPEGWHVPSYEEWSQLEIILGMSEAEQSVAGNYGSDEGGKLKEAGTAHWNNPNAGATNESGFTARPGGFRQADGSYKDIGNTAYFWLHNESAYYLLYQKLYYDRADIYHAVETNGGFSVRCIKD